MKHKFVTVAGCVVATSLALVAVSASAGHMPGGFYKHSAHGKYCGAPKRMFTRPAHPRCHAVPAYRGYGYGKWRPSGQHGKPMYQTHGWPGGKYSHQHRSASRGGPAEGGYKMHDSGTESGAGGDYAGNQSGGGPASKDILGTATAVGEFSMLISAVKAAGLADTLKGDGPFTVLAPNDSAFGKLPEEQVTRLMSDPEALKGVLTYHVISGRLSAADLLEQGTAETISGATVNITQLDVAKADVGASNGIIHVLDAVLVPTE